MTSRERILAAINHQEPDYVPLDLGARGQTGMNTCCNRRRFICLQERNQGLEYR